MKTSELNKKVTIMMYSRLLSIILSALVIIPAWAQDESMPGMDHGTMDHGTMDHSTMDHSTMNNDEIPDDARDPHAYSGGYSLESGPYAMKGPRQLRLGDEHIFASVLVDRFESVHTSDANSIAYDLNAWIGTDYDRLVIKAEGDYDNSRIEEASTELFWGHAIDTFWDSRLGIRYDSGEGPNRTWLGAGVEGLAPYWFEVDATAYIGEEGRTAFSVEVEYELLFTQKLILQPRIEANFYGKNDSARSIGSGLSETAAGLRLRYEIRREFAPYIGVEWANKYGRTADYAREEGKDVNETRIVAGIRFWF